MKIETQTTWEVRWDSEKVEQLKRAIKHCYLDCEANGEDEEQRKEQPKDER